MASYETLRKACARFWRERHVREYVIGKGLHSSAYRHICLASDAGGDVATWRAFGVPDEDIVACDIDNAALAACAEKHGLGPVYLHTDILDAVENYVEGERRLDVFADFCGKLQPARLRDISRLWMLCRPWDILSINTERARESISKRHREVVHAFDKSPLGSRMLRRMITGEINFNPRALMDVTGDTWDTTRLRLILTALDLGDPTHSSTWDVVSWIKYCGRGRSPMSVLTIVKQPWSDYDDVGNTELKSVCIDDEYAAEWRRSMLTSKEIDNITKANVLNVARASVPAMKATISRGLELTS